MKTVVLFLVIGIMVLTSVGMVMAVPAGKTVVFEDGAMGKVTFDGKVHADAGLKCNDCHTKIFQMKKGSVKITAPHKPGEFCGVCHDGTKAFAQEGNCAKCHQK